MINVSMFKSLRNRLILSHILPLLIILPLMGIGLIYILETQVYIPALANELENDARFTAQLTRLDEAIWQDPEKAQAIVNLYSTRAKAKMMLIDSGDELLASNDPSDLNLVNKKLEDIDFSAITRSAGSVTRQIHYSSSDGAEVIDVFVPVSSENNQLLGYVRISYPFASLSDEIYQLRFLIFILLAVGLIIGSVLGYILAVSVSKPVREVTKAISLVANHSQMKPINIYGPEEVQLLSQSVNDLALRLRELEQARRQLLANLVHEIGRPLGALRSAITALSGGAEKDPVLYDDLLKGMDEEMQQLQRLLNDLSGLHDQVLGVTELDRQPIDLKVWLLEILRTWQAAAREKGIQWDLKIEDNTPVIDGDPTRLAQVLGNLVSNAIKFTPHGGSIIISTHTTGEKVAISVRDTGPGITPEEQERIFEPFFQGLHGRRFPQGMGLGLSIARDLTRAHGGNLSVESIPGHGSQFTVWLPVDERSSVNVSISQ